MSQTLEKFVGVTDWHEEQYSSNLMYGVMDWCKWAMLQAGGYQNVAVGQTNNVYGGNMARLRPVTDPNYRNGQVWESARSDWVWETGIERSLEPTVASGVYIDDVFYPTIGTTGEYSHYINYPLGRIVFNSPIASDSVVEADYSCRSVSFVKSKEPWFTQLLYNSFNIELDDFLSATGSHNQLSQARRQLPAVGLELVNRRSGKAYEIGNFKQFVFQDMLFYILAENDEDCWKITDILHHQNDRVICLPDRSAIKISGRFPIDLDYRGTPVSSPMVYPDIISEFAWTRVQFTNTTVQTLQAVNNWLYRAVVRTSFEAIL